VPDRIRGDAGAGGRNYCTVEEIAMAGDLTIGDRLTGDSSGAIRGMRLTEAELERLSRAMQHTQRRAQEMGDSLTSRIREAAASTFDLRGAMAGLAAGFAADQLIDFA